MSLGQRGGGFSLPIVQTQPPEGEGSAFPPALERRKGLTTLGVSGGGGGLGGC